MKWKIRDLAAEETHNLRRSVSADGRTDLPSMHHEMDDTPGAWHLGAVDEAGRIVAISSFCFEAFPPQPEVQPAVQLAFMAVDPSVQGEGIGTAVMTKAIRRLKASDAILLWANARDLAWRFYEKFGFRTVPRGEYALPESGRPHHLIELDLTWRTLNRLDPLTIRSTWSPRRNLSRLA